MEIIIGEIVSIDQLVDCSWISSLSHEQINVRRVGSDILRATHIDLISIAIKNLDTCKANVVDIAPSLQNIELDGTTFRKRRDNERSIKILNFILEYVILCLD